MNKLFVCVGLLGLMASLTAMAAPEKPVIILEKKNSQAYRPDAALAAAFGSFHTRLQNVLTTSGRVTVKTEAAIAETVSDGAILCNYEIISGKPTGIVFDGKKEYLVGVSMQAFRGAMEAVPELTGTFEFKDKVQIPEEIVGIAIRQLSNIILADVAPMRITDMEDKDVVVDFGRELLKKGDLLKVYGIRKNGKRSLRPTGLVRITETNGKESIGTLVKGTATVGGLAVWARPGDAEFSDTETGGELSAAAVNGGVALAQPASSGSGHTLEIRSISASDSFLRDSTCNALVLQQVEKKNALGSVAGLVSAFGGRKAANVASGVGSVAGTTSETACQAAAIKLPMTSAAQSAQVCGRRESASCELLRSQLAGQGAALGCRILMRDQRSDDEFTRQGQNLGDYYLQGTVLSYTERHTPVSTDPFTVNIVGQLTTSIRMVNRASGADLLNKTVTTTVTKNNVAVSGEKSVAARLSMNEVFAQAASDIVTAIRPAL